MSFGIQTIKCRKRVFAGAEDRGAPGDQMVGVLDGLGMLDDPVSRAAVVQLIQVSVHPLQRPAPRS